MSKKATVTIEVDPSVTPETLHEFLCIALQEMATDLSKEMFGMDDAIIDIEMPKEI